MPSEPARPGLWSTLDNGPWTAFRRQTVLLCIATMIIDGFDVQLIGVVMPLLIRDWGVDRAAFVPVITLGLIGMSVGTAIAGPIGNRIGRRTGLIASMLIFGIATLATMLVTSIPQLIAVRLAAAIGLGAALPNAIAILSEFTPLRRRSFMVTLATVCTPLGGVIAGLVMSIEAIQQDWRLLFLLGGLLPLAFAVVLMTMLPESPSLLRMRPDGKARLAALAARLGASADEHPLSDAADESTGMGYRALLAPAYRHDTLLIWLAFSGVLTAAYTSFNWLPALLVAGGFDVAIAGRGLAGYDFGGIAGALAGAFLIGRLGSRALTMTYAAGAVLVLLGMTMLFGDGMTATGIIAGLVVAGTLTAGLQPMLFAVAANRYPDFLRPTGVGAALAIGRAAAIGSSAMGALLVDHGATVFFGFQAVVMVVVLLALLRLRRHIVPTEMPAP